MKRIWHHFEKWEEALMWDATPSEDRVELLAQAIKFTGNAKLYGEWMLKVLDQWPVSCEQNLSNISANRRAWIGHAASYLAVKATEDVTREAWGHLTQEQQDEANGMADEAIREWHRRQRANNATQKDLYELPA